VLGLERFRQRLLVGRQQLQYFRPEMRPRDRRVCFDGAEIRGTRADRAFIDHVVRDGRFERCTSGHLAIAERFQLVLMPVHDRFHLIALLRRQIELGEREVDGAAGPHGAAAAHPAAWAARSSSEAGAARASLRQEHRAGILCADADAGRRNDDRCS
jgi:hypothetical protein